MASNFALEAPGFEASLNTYDNDIGVSELRGLFEESVRSSPHAPRFYDVRDGVGYPSVLAVWQEDKGYRFVKIYLGNDSKGIRWQVGSGEYEMNSDWTYDPFPNDWRKHKPF